MRFSLGLLILAVLALPAVSADGIPHPETVRIDPSDPGSAIPQGDDGDAIIKAGGRAVDADVAGLYGVRIGCELGDGGIRCFGYVCTTDSQSQALPVAVAQPPTVGVGVDPSPDPDTGEYGPYAGAYVDPSGFC